MVSLGRDFLVQKLAIWEAASFSKTFDSTGRMDTNCKWSTMNGVSTFEMGLICTSFQVHGKYSFKIQLPVLMIAVRRPNRCSEASFYKVGECVTQHLLRGVCLSRQLLNKVLRVSNWSSGSSVDVTIENGNVAKSSRKAFSLKFFRFLIHFYLGW